MTCEARSDGRALSRQGIPVSKSVPLTGMKKAIAEHMSNCHQQVASVSVFADFNVDALIAARNQGRFEVEGVKVTLTHVLIRLVADTLRKFPLLNASIEDGAIQVLDDINIGMAAALPDGNLIVPVIRNADRLSIGEIAVEARRLAGLAADGKLGLADIRGGTFTLTNVGMVRGTLWQTPLVNLPQAGILALGRIREAPVVRNGQLAVGSLMGASLSFDHRIINGFPASQFMEALGDAIDNVAAHMEAKK
ncbi:2-oxoacid dehydrogenase/acyltransferase catalytic subunit [Pseudaminobacter salicylatoxidans]|uniref:2-oxoacid dehydrogenase/acyltransferase catalytic subunit n=1 Tax=Pseudaminobacter salicylatoxidans TaxID=93369 RepID=A0A316C4G8_PSESE|nr:2-oxoacid dehydrogenase/acyltransferase catalytic subunit [Pseudaminobacter salicylatoxidans]